MPRHISRIHALPLYILVALGSAAAQAQDAAPERWNLYYQATSIGQYHPEFSAAYSGPLSLLNHREAEVSLTSTVYLGIRLARHTELYFNPELAGGRAFSGTTGVADFPNGEMPRVATATPKPYLARLYVTQDFGVGERQEMTSSDANQLSGSRPMTRYSITVGRFTVTDFFDNNRYSHDPRTQFMAWAMMYNGAYDYPADTRGYTWGWVHEFHTERWSLRYASVAGPRFPNGLRFDRRLLRNRGDVIEGEVSLHAGDREGAVRVLSYFNHFNAGNYAEALRAPGIPDVAATRQNGTLKYGFGLSADQEVAKGLGLFGRLGWNDGKTESFAFTVIDRLATVGTSINGARWHRADDTAASALTICGLSGVHAAYLARGGLDFLIGDGALRYGRETLWESYYAAKLKAGFTATLDVMRLVNPAYNRDRGPVWIGSFRLHVEFGRK